MADFTRMPAEIKLKFADDAITRQRQSEEFTLKMAQIRQQMGQAGAKASPLYALNATKAVFKAVYGRDPTQDELVKIAGVGGTNYEKEDGKFIDSIIGEGVKTGTIDPKTALQERDRMAKDAAALRKPPAALPKGLPAGSKFIGQSGGKDVYQLPDGSRVKEQ